jgi:hypothetical protein
LSLITLWPLNLPSRNALSNSATPNTTSTNPQSPTSAMNAALANAGAGATITGPLPATAVTTSASPNLSMPAVTLPAGLLADPSPQPLGLSLAGGAPPQSVPEPTVLNLVGLLVLAHAWRFASRNALGLVSCFIAPPVREERLPRE